jgi:ABC-type bacteriocin/lantibiotic exporter with double-glycine peptidase domain
MHWRRIKPHFAPPFAPVHDRPGAVTVDSLRAYRQSRSYSCGFASALMVLRSFGRAVEGRELFESLGTGRSGTRQNAIIRELRRRDTSANVRYDLDFDALCRAIDAGKLIIGYLFDAEHWLVVYGYGLAPARVFVADPRPGEGCEQAWDSYAGRLDGFGIVCSPRRPRRRSIELPAQQLSLWADGESA